MRICLEVGERERMWTGVSPEEGPCPGPQVEAPAGKGQRGCGCVCTRELPEHARAGRWEEGEGPGMHPCRMKAGGEAAGRDGEVEAGSVFSAPQCAAFLGRGGGWVGFLVPGILVRVGTNRQEEVS